MSSYLLCLQRSPSSPPAKRLFGLSKPVLDYTGTHACILPTVPARAALLPCYSASMEPPSPKKSLDLLTNKFNKRRDQAWRSHMGTATRMRLSVTTRMATTSNTIKMHSAFFHAIGPEPMCSEMSVLKRFPADCDLTSLQEEVATAFHWADSALFFVSDAYSNMRPVATCAEFKAACEHWENAVGERKLKHLAKLLVEVEEQLLSNDDPEVQLAGAMAAWEIACEKGHHERINEDFLLATQSALLSDDFAVACHAAAAIQSLRCDPAMQQAFGTRIVGGLARALRMTLTPPELVPEACSEPIVGLCRLPVLSLHAMLDPRPDPHTGVISSPREVAVAFGKYEIEPLLWQLYFQAVVTHDGKRAALRQARFEIPEGLDKADAAAAAEDLAMSTALRLADILKSRWALERQSLDLLCTLTAMLPSSAPRLAEAGVLPQLRQRLGRALDARAELAAAAAAAAVGAEGANQEGIAEVAEARAEARRCCLQLLGLLNTLLRSPEARAQIRHRDAAALLLMCTKHGLLLFQELEEVQKKARGAESTGFTMADVTKVAQIKSEGQLEGQAPLPEPQEPPRVVEEVPPPVRPTNLQQRMKNASSVLGGGASKAMAAEEVERPAATVRAREDACTHAPKHAG